MTTTKNKPSVQDQQKAQAAPAHYFCGGCSLLVTSADERLEIDGSHGHIFTNPAGRDFHLGCFSSATGCSVLGQATYDYTWFANFSWQMALCANCEQHLGWFFDDGAGREFFGLVLAKLKSET